MASALLEHFASAVVRRLVERGLLEIREGREASVAHAVAGELGKGSHRQLISTFTAALVASDDVVEVYADAEDFEAIIADLDAISAGLRG